MWSISFCFLKHPRSKKSILSIFLPITAPKINHIFLQNMSRPRLRVKIPMLAWLSPVPVFWSRELSSHLRPVQITGRPRCFLLPANHTGGNEQKLRWRHYGIGQVALNSHSVQRINNWNIKTWCDVFSRLPVLCGVWEIWMYLSGLVRPGSTSSSMER